MWVPVAATHAEMRIFAHNWTRLGAERRKSKLESEGLRGFRFAVHRLGPLDWRVIPEMWKSGELHEGELA